mmetsp:Transcript_64716/g.75962  ORF Transcript_64716/g.75962 Transcript_64716/m.75962 type:complete len:110 (+) Transcript_64716:1726-2055(+)
MLVKSRTPRCACCIFGAMTKQPRRNKAQPKKLQQATKLGKIVSDYQMKAGSPGLITQLKGYLTTQRYRYATVFIDHPSQLRFMWLQRTLSLEDTLEAKYAFKAFSSITM